MIKYHFYKCGRQPDEAHRYYDHSTGIAGFLAPQERNGYLGYLTVEEAEEPIKKASHGKRRFRGGWRG